MGCLHKLIFLFFAVIIGIGFLFAVSDNTYIDGYSACLQSNTEQNCTNYFSLAKNVAHIIDLTYTKDQNILVFVDCIKNEKLKDNFDYRNARTICYNNQIKNTSASFKANCFYDLNGNDLNGASLTVKCKGIFPSNDYSWDISLGKDLNNNVLIQPKLILNSDFALNGTSFDLFVKSFDLPSLNIPQNSNFSILPLSLDVNNSSKQLDILLSNLISNNNTMDQLYRSYLDCITMKVLLSDIKGDNFNLKKSGYNFTYTPEKLITSCKDDIAYTFAIDFEQYDSKKINFFDMTDLLLKNYLSDSNFEYDNMKTYLNDLVTEYSRFAETEKSIDQMKDVVLKLSLDTDYFLLNLQKVTKSLNEDDKKNVLSSAGPTLLRNKEDTLDVRRRTKLSLILDFFNNDQNTIIDDSIKTIYSDIAYSLIKKHFEDNNVIDLTNVNGTITPQGISLDKYIFDFGSKQLTLDYKGDSNNVFTIIKDINGIIIDVNDYKINTLLSITLENNALSVSNKEIAIIDKNKITEIYRGVSEIKQVDLLIEDTLPVYVIQKEISGKLLGIIKIKEKIKAKYYATTGILYNTEKPWWDFLVVYN